MTTSVARQAIVNDAKEIVAYELFNRSVSEHAHTASTDAQALFNLLTLSDGETQVGRTLLFINCTHDSLSGGHLDLVAPEHVVLEIPPLSHAQFDQIDLRLPALQSTQARGFKLAFDHTVMAPSYESWLPLAAYIKLDVSFLTGPALASLVQMARSKTTAQLIAEKVETEEQFTRLKALGVTLFQGYWFAKPTLIEGQSLRPSQAAILQLIDLVRKQASTADIEEVLKRDPTLSFNLLRFINSAGFGLQTEVTSFKHAVMLLGLKKLFKWAALLMTTSANSGVAPAVGTTAVVRGRLMELLAAETLPPEDCDHAFVIGVFSLLDSLLGMSMEAALANLPLPQVVRDALLHRSGPMSEYLKLALACESGDDLAFADSARTLKLTDRQINWAHLQALAWAETLGQE